MINRLSLRQMKALAAVRSILTEEAERLYVLADYADHPSQQADREMLDCATRLHDAEAVLLRCING